MPRHELVRLVADRPSLLTRWGRVIRSFRLGPWKSSDPELSKYFGGGPTLSGISVNEMSAMASSAVWSAVTMISDDIASLPLMLYKRLKDGGKDRFEDHPLYQLLHDAPNPEMDPMVCFRTMQAHVLVWQNAYAEIERDGAGRPVAIWPLVPERVTPFRDHGAFKYRVTNPSSGGDVTIDAADMVHLVGHSHDGSVGSSLVLMARESIALGLAAERFGASFFGNGSTFGGVISFKGPRPPQMTEKEHQEKLDVRHQGVERAYKLLALYNEAKYEKTGVAPNEGQFNETRIFQIREIARWFKMPPHRLGDLADATYSNVEQMDAAYLSSCIRPWLVLWRQQLSRKLIARSERRIQFIEHDTHGFLSVDAASRGELYSKEFRVGGLKINEIRGYENRDPIQGGDRAFVSLDVIPVEKVDAYWDAIIDRKKQPQALQPAPSPEPDPEDQADRAALRAAVMELQTTLEALRAENRSNAQKIEDLSGALDAMEDRAEQAEANHSQAIELLDGARASLASEQSERAREKAEADASVDSHRELAELALNRESTAKTALDAAGRSLESVAIERDAAVQRAECAEAERDAETARALTVKGHLDDAMNQSLADREAKATAEAERDVERARADQAERDKVEAEQSAVAANEALEQRRAEESARVTRVLAAHRALIVDAMRRVVTKETDRARRHQATPTKLRAWMDTFYPDHVEAMAEAIRPVIAAQMAWTGDDSDPNEVAGALAAAHCQRSQEQIRMALAVEDFAPTFERMLQRWEQGRPEIVADRFLQEGVTYVRSL